MGNAQNKEQFYYNECPWILFWIGESNTFCVDNIMLAKTWFSINNVILPISFILLHCYILIKYSLI